MVNVTTLRNETLLRLAGTGLPVAADARAEIARRFAVHAEKRPHAAAKRPIKQSNGSVDLSRTIPGFHPPRWRGERAR